MGLRRRGAPVGRPAWGRLTPTRRATGFVVPRSLHHFGADHRQTGLSIDPLIRSVWPGVPCVPLDHVDDAAEVRRLARPGADGRPLVPLHHCLGLMEGLVD